MVNSKVSSKKPAVKKAASKVAKKTTVAKAKVTKAVAKKAPAISDDFKNALLIVSVTINLAIFIGWLALKLTNVYDSQVYKMLFW